MKRYRSRSTFVCAQRPLSPSVRPDLLVEPQKVPREIEIPEGLKALQEAVGESIEATYPFEDFVALVTNGNGKFDGSQLNRALRTEDGEFYDIIAGNFLVVGLGSEDFASLSNELVAKYKDYFGVPEIFLKVNGKLHILPASPKE